VVLLELFRSVHGVSLSHTHDGRNRGSRAQSAWLRCCAAAPGPRRSERRSPALPAVSRTGSRSRFECHPPRACFPAETGSPATRTAPCRSAAPPACRAPRRTPPSAPARAWNAPRGTGWSSSPPIHEGGTERAGETLAVGAHQVDAALTVDLRAAEEEHVDAPLPGQVEQLARTLGERVAFPLVQHRDAQVLPARFQQFASSRRNRRGGADRDVLRLADQAGDDAGE